MENIKFIRDERSVLELGEDGKFHVKENYKTINAAKKFTRIQPPGTVARRETIVKTHGEKFYRGLLA